MKKIFLVLASLLICVNIFAQSSDFDKYIIPFKDAHMSVVAEVASAVNYMTNNKIIEVCKTNIEKGVYSQSTGSKKALEFNYNEVNKRIDCIVDLLEELPSYMTEYSLTEEFVKEFIAELKLAYTDYSLIKTQLKRYL